MSQLLSANQAKTIHAVIFDMDGTLYSSRKMKLCMACDLLLYYTLHPLRIQEPYILYTFRKTREAIKDNNTSLQELQYELPAKILSINPVEVKNVVEKWILIRPLTYIKFCRYHSVKKLFLTLNEHNKKIIIASEYPVEEKLHALELFSDLNLCSLDNEINAFKPDPKNFLLASQKLNIKPEHFLVIGDREEKDGICANRSGMFFVDVSKNTTKLFDILTKQFS